jgi:hypothetical protein
MPQQAAQPQARRQIVAYTYHHLQHLLHAGLVRTRGGGPASITCCPALESAS